MRNRVLILPAAAVVILALCAYKVTRTEQRQGNRARQTLGPAPHFELLDSSKPPRTIRLTSYLGRHPIIVVFFDETQGAENDPRMNWIIQNSMQIDRADIYVFAISGATPFQNRKVYDQLTEGYLENRLYLLTDNAPPPGAPGLGYLVHRKWGRYDEKTKQPQQGFYLINRAGHLLLTSQLPTVVKLGDPALDEFLDKQ